MIGDTLRHPAARALSLPSLLLGVSLVAGCGVLDVGDPTAIKTSDLANATSADLMRRNALGQLYGVISDAAVQSGMLTDEFFADPRRTDVPAGIISNNRAADQRLGDRLERGGEDVYRRLQQARQSASTAMDQIRAYVPAEPGQAYIGQMFAVRGYTTLVLAEDYCPGFPLNEVVDGRLAYRPPLPAAGVYERALADFDSAVVYAADSTRIRHAAELGRARALMGLGRIAEAGTAATSVPTPYVWNAEYTTSDIYQPNTLAFQLFSARESVADREGGTGLDFRAANDPRVETTFLGTAYDGVTGIYASAKYPDESAPMVLASGVEARLIEAEAALQSGGDWLGILNQLRATQVSPAMAVLADPGTDAARVDLLFRERAFWLFATGHRLGDLRRLLRIYGRMPESVFPTGPYRLGDTYGTAVSVTFPVASEKARNPAVTGCTGA
jgi:hypothetical protein